MMALKVASRAEKYKSYKIRAGDDNLEMNKFLKLLFKKNIDKDR